MARRRRKSKRFLTGFFILLLITAVYFVYDNYFKEEPEIPIPDGAIAVYYIDVGQGDATLIVTPTGETMLIDAGEYGEAADYLEEKNIKALDYLVFTHYDSDHIGGGDDVLALCDVEKIIAPDCVPETKTGKTLITLMEEEGAERIDPKQGYTFTLGNVFFEILSSAEIQDKGSNDDSICMMMTYGDTKFLFTGDAEEKRQEQIVDAYGTKLDADVFQAGHHGSKNANSQELVDLVTPDYVIFSCGEGNSYGHPHPEAVDRLDDYADVLLRTDKNGTVIFFSDGETITYQTEKEVTEGATRTVYSFLCFDAKRLCVLQKSLKCA